MKEQKKSKVRSSENVLKERNKGGRPKLYSEELAAKVLKAISTIYASLDKICEENDELPSSTTVYDWMYDYPMFSDKYLEAKQRQQLLAGDKCMKVAESIELDAPNKGIYLKAIQWQAARLKPDVWSEKTQIDHNIKTHESWLKDMD